MCSTGMLGDLADSVDGFAFYGDPVIRDLDGQRLRRMSELLARRAFDIWCAWADERLERIWRETLGEERTDVPA